VLELRFDVVEHDDGIAARLDGIGDRAEVLPDRILLYASDGDAALAAVSGRGLRPTSALVRRSTLEDVFLHLTGRTLVD
jgi:lipooligosaccharide transport system ATP-binding protein